MHRHSRLIKAGIATAIVTILVATTVWKLWGGWKCPGGSNIYASKEVCEGSCDPDCTQT